MSSRLTQIIEYKDGKQAFKVTKGEQKTFVILLGGQEKSEQNIEVELAGEGAEAQILGMVVGKNSDSITLNTLQKHTAPNTTSDLLVKGVFSEKSKFKYRGLIEIAKDAQNANAFQQENNLVLSSAVYIDTRPELEIEANEVRCTHAATVAPLDKEQLYYMRTRGVSKTQAEQLIIAGFLAEVMERINDKSIRQHIRREIDTLLQ